MTLISLVQLAVSVALLVTASTVGAQALPAWGGPVDVMLVFSLALSGALLYWAADGKVVQRALRVSYHVAVSLPALVLVAIWLFRDTLNLNVLLPGLAWRLFITLYVLPFGIEAWWRERSAGEAPSR